MIENFDMSPADDIDYPLLYSRQRETQGSDDRASRVFRVSDAKRMMRAHPLIDSESVSATIQSSALVVDFDLINETEQESYLL